MWILMLPHPQALTDHASDKIDIVWSDLISPCKFMKLKGVLLCVQYSKKKQKKVEKKTPKKLAD